MKFVYNLSRIKLFTAFLRINFNFRKYSVRTPHKILFFGSDKIALGSLRKVNELRKSSNLIERLDLVTTNNSTNESAIEKYAISQNIKMVSWPLQNLKHAEYEIGLIVAFGHMITKEMLEKFPLGMVNVHPSLLPRWRGAAPIIHTLLHGDTVTGVTLMKIKPDKFDVGEIIYQEKIPVCKDITLPELTEQLSDLGAEMLVKCLKTLPDCLINAIPQSNDEVTYARKISKNISEVRWAEMTAEEVYNLHRAVYNLYPLITTFKDTKVKLFDIFLNKNDGLKNEGTAGNVEYCPEKSAIKVLCKDKNYIYIKSLRILGKRKITALDFYNGYIKNDPNNIRHVVFQ